MHKIIINVMKPKQYLNKLGFTSEELKGLVFDTDDQLRDFLDSNELSNHWDYPLNEFDVIVDGIKEDFKDFNKTEYALIFNRLWELWQ